MPKNWLCCTSSFLMMLVTLLGSVSAAEDKPYPSRPITLVVPTEAGGGTDLIARATAMALSTSMKQPVIVENRAGANAILGVDQVARAPADGYRLLFTYAASMVINPSLYQNLPYAPLKDFAPIAQVGRGGNLLLVRADFPGTTLQEFVAYVKARPGATSYCSWGIGSGGHLAMESLKQQAGLQSLHVPFKGSQPCVQALAASQVDAAFSDVSASQGLLQSGRLKALAYSGATRVPVLPEVPTLTQAGVIHNQQTWYALFAPAGTPNAIVMKLNAEVNRALISPEFVERLYRLGLYDLPVTTPEQLGELVRQDIKDWGSLIKGLGISLN